MSKTETKTYKLAPGVSKYTGDFSLAGDNEIELRPEDAERYRQKDGEPLLVEARKKKPPKASKDLAGGDK